MMERIEPIAGDRSVERIEPPRLAPVERERERQRRERERERRRGARPRPQSPSREGRSGIDVRV